METRLVMLFTRGLPAIISILILNIKSVKLPINMFFHSITSCLQRVKKIDCHNFLFKKTFYREADLREA